MKRDYSNYSYIELKAMLLGVDQKKYPENYQNILDAINTYDRTKNTIEVDGKLVVDESKENLNEIKRRESEDLEFRVLLLIAAILLMGYGCYGLYTNNLVIPPFYRGGEATYLKDGGVLLGFIGIIFFSISLVSTYYRKKKSILNTVKLLSFKRVFIVSTFLGMFFLQIAPYLNP